MRSVALALLIVFIAVTSFAAVPRLIMPADDGADAVVLSQVKVRVTIRGHLARTEYTLAFRNNLSRDTGGDFAFPLPPDAEVSDLGLFFNGKLRHAVAVERVQARRAYEETVHRRVDPALAEWSDSRAFRMRLYPIPAHGEKWVFIACDQELVSNDYLLDLRFKQKVDSFSIFVDSDGLPVIADGVTFVGGKASATNAVLDATIKVRHSEIDTALAAWSEREGAWLVSAPLRVGGAEHPFDPATHVTLLWDASGSAVQQNSAALRAFLDAFLRRQAAWATVTVIPFHLWVDEPRRTTAHDLGRVLDAIDVAGATNLAAVLQQLPAIAAHVPESRLVLVTDGINSMGDAQHLTAAANALGVMHRPLTVVNAAPRANEQLLRSLAESTGGRYLDLTTTSPADAAERAMLRPTRIELPSFTPRVVSTAGATRVLIASRTATRPPVLPVAGRELAVREVDVPDLVLRAWARARLRELSVPEEIAAHGKRYTMLTPRTSLLVLETLRDYEFYGIDPPEDLAIERVRYAIPPQQQRVAWFIRGSVLAKDGSPLPGATVELLVNNVVLSSTVTDANGRFWLPSATAPATKFVVRAELAGYGQATRQMERTPSGAEIQFVLNPSVSESITVTAEAPMLDVRAAGMAINVSRDAPDVELPDDLARVRSALDGVPLAERHALVQRLVERIGAARSESARMHEYALARAVAGGEKLLHVGAAELLRGDDGDLGLRVLTDLAEAYADDAPIVRIVARIADGWGHPDVARELLLHALEDSPMEPQTWRELLILAQRTGRTADEAALKARFDAAVTSSHLRLPPDALDLDAHDGADLQVDIMWECDYCDVDLHVIEPGGEEVMYNHRTSKHGGQLSADITNGFGPEIYAISRAPRGPYKVVVEYYGEDRTEVSAETLVHVVVTTRGRFGGVHRRDHTLLLSKGKERAEVATVNLD